MSQNKVKASTSQSSTPAEQLLQQAETHIDKFEYDAAQQFCQRALELEPNNIAVLETMASVLLELGETDKAKPHFNRAVTLSPDTGHTKYMSLAQLCVGKEAVKQYSKGIEILGKELERVGNDDNERRALIKKELSDAYCSLSELFTTDLCDEDDAEKQCCSYVEKAISADPKNPEAYLCKANVSFIKQDITEAKSAMQTSLSLWLPQFKTIMDGKGEDVDLVYVCALPYNSRINTVKLLLDMEDYTTAFEILELLLLENDADVEIWYLSGLAHYLKGEESKATARYYLKKAQKVSKKTGIEEPTIMEHIDSMLAELGPGIGGDSDDDESDADDKENANVANDDDDESIILSSDGDDDNTMEV